jgi:hypothetical protein
VLHSILCGSRAGGEEESYIFHNGKRSPLRGEKVISDLDFIEYI